MKGRTTPTQDITGQASPAGPYLIQTDCLEHRIWWGFPFIIAIGVGLLIGLLVHNLSGTLVPALAGGAAAGIAFWPTLLMTIIYLPSLQNLAHKAVSVAVSLALAGVILAGIMYLTVQFMICIS